MSPADQVLVALTLASLAVVVLSVPAAVFIVWVYQQRSQDNELLRSVVRWVVLTVVAALLVLVLIAWALLAASWPGTIVPPPRPWATIVLLAALDIFPLYVIATARTWRRLRTEGTTLDGPPPADPPS